MMSDLLLVVLPVVLLTIGSPTWAFGLSALPPSFSFPTMCRQTRRGTTTMQLQMVAMANLTHTGPATTPPPDQHNDTTTTTMHPPNRDILANDDDNNNSHERPPNPDQNHGTAILLNPNARSVTPHVIATARAVLGDAHVYVTETPDQAAAAIARMVQQQRRRRRRRQYDNATENDNAYSLVIPVGGDGTLAGIIDMWTHEILAAAAATDEDMTMEAAVVQLPAFAYLPLGTGNGLGSVVGNPVKTPFWRRRMFSWWRRRRRRHATNDAPPTTLTDTLQRLRRVGQALAQTSDTTNSTSFPHHSVYTHDFDHDSRDWEWLTMPMMQVTSQPAEEMTTAADAHNTEKGDLCFFAGVGFDSLMLNDFKQIKNWSVQTGWFKGLLGSVAGYCVALVVRTLPQSLQGKHRIHVEVTSPSSSNTVNATSDPVLWVDHSRGDVVRRITLGSTLFEGTTGIVAAGTSPFYGGGLRLFPFARMTVDQMHLRVGRIPPWQGMLQLPQIFAGTYRDKTSDHRNLGCLDFIGDDFEVAVRPVVPSDGKKWNPGENNSDTPSGDAEEGYPLQHSGEAVGHVTRFRLRVVKEPIRFVCLRKSR